MPRETPYSRFLALGAPFFRFFVTEPGSVFSVRPDSRFRLRDAGGTVTPTSESVGSDVRWVAATIPREAWLDADAKRG